MKIEVDLDELDAWLTETARTYTRRLQATAAALVKASCEMAEGQATMAGTSAAQHEALEVVDQLPAVRDSLFDIAKGLGRRGARIMQVFDEKTKELAEQTAGLLRGMSGRNSDSQNAVELEAASDHMANLHTGFSDLWRDVNRTFEVLTSSGQEAAPAVYFLPPR